MFSRKNELVQLEIDRYVHPLGDGRVASFCGHEAPCAHRSYGRLIKKRRTGRLQYPHFAGLAVGSDKDTQYDPPFLSGTQQHAGIGRFGIVQICRVEARRGNWHRRGWSRRRWRRWGCRQGRLGCGRRSLWCRFLRWLGRSQRFFTRGSPGRFLPGLRLGGSFFRFGLWFWFRFGFRRRRFRHLLPDRLLGRQHLDHDGCYHRGRGKRRLIHPCQDQPQCADMGSRNKRKSTSSEV